MHIQRANVIWLSSAMLLVLVQGTEAGEPAPIPGRAADKVIRIWQEGGWKGELPDGWKTEGEEKSIQQAHMGGTTAISNVSVPLLEYFAPAAGTGSKSSDGRAVIICPGGGYHILAWDLEGQEIGRWLSDLGIHAFVLKYRLPLAGASVRHAAALQDAQRAISLVRARAEAMQISPKRIGILGFSAGGHLTAMASTAWRSRGYSAKDEIDQASCRPDFSVLVYPGGLAKDATTELADGLVVDGDTPPSILIHAADDGLPMAHSMAWALALNRVKVPAELHVYPDGGHGYGLRSAQSVRAWPDRVEEWLARLP